MPDPVTKCCRKCGEVKPLDEFARRAGARDGHRGTCTACRSRQDSGRYQANREAKLEYQRQYYRDNTQAVQDYQRSYRTGNRDIVLGHYGWTCACCGALEQLTIDHVNGDGAGHRQRLYGNSQRGLGADHFYVWLIKQGFPADYQTLCRACNSSKRNGKRCRLDHRKVPDAPR